MTAPAAVDHRQIPRETRARVLNSAATLVDGARNPMLVLPDIAHRNHLTLEQTKATVFAHGWPRPLAMRRAADLLLTHGDDAATAAAINPNPAPTGTAADQTFQLVAVDELHPDPNNVRDDLGDLTELARSIRDVGILQPIVARQHNGQLVIVMGHRRHAAAITAGLAQVPVITRTDMDPDDVLAAMIVENGQRLDLDPIEEARALTRLKRADRSTDALLADRISKSQTYVSGRLALLSLTPQQQAAVRAGTLPLARAVKLGRDQGGTARPNATGKKSAAHLAWHHPLAEKASVTCQAAGHSKNTPGYIGTVACGRCWEDTIRADERTNAGGHR